MNAEELKAIRKRYSDAWYPEHDAEEPWRMSKDIDALLAEVERQRIEGVELTVERDYFMRQATERLDENKRLRGLLERCHREAFGALSVWTDEELRSSAKRECALVLDIRTELEGNDERGHDTGAGTIGCGG